MSWTYSGDPSSSDRDALRFLIGDTDTTDQQLTDEELDYLLTFEGSVTAAAIAAIRSLIAKFARFADRSVGDLRVAYSQRIDNYRGLLDQLETRQVIHAGKPIAGGLSKARKQIVDEDADRVQPAFRRNQFDDDENQDDFDDLLR